MSEAFDSIENTDELLATLRTVEPHPMHYRSTLIDGEEFETIGLSTWARTPMEAEQIASEPCRRGYKTRILQHGDIYRVWTSVLPQDDMPEKPSMADVQDILEKFERFLQAFLIRLNKDLEEPMIVKEDLIADYDAKWGRRNGLHAGGHLRGSMNYSHPILMVDTEQTDLFMYVSHEEMEAFGIFIEPWSMYRYSVTHHED